MMNTRVVNCPQCSKPVVWDTANRHRPFCSERCRMADLGAWASENYRIPAQEQDGIESASESDETEPPRG